MQQIVSRQLNPIEPAVISVTKFISGTTNNVLPNSALLAGTVRTFNPRSEILSPTYGADHKGITEAHGASYQFDYVRGYAPVINDTNAATLVESVVTEVLRGTSWVDKWHPIWLLKTSQHFLLMFRAVLFLLEPERRRLFTRIITLSLILMKMHWSLA